MIIVAGLSAQVIVIIGCLYWRGKGLPP